MTRVFDGDSQNGHLLAWLLTDRVQVENMTLTVDHETVMAGWHGDLRDFAAGAVLPKCESEMRLLGEGGDLSELVVVADLLEENGFDRLAGLFRKAASVEGGV